MGGSAPERRAMTGPVFITGAGGFIGAELVAQIASDGVPVRLLLRHPNVAGPLPRSTEAQGNILVEFNSAVRVSELAPISPDTWA